jgi:hypothetical protein
VGSPIEESPVLRLHAPTRGGIAACRALLRLSSRAILQTAFAWSGRMVVSVWRLVNSFLLVRRYFLLSSPLHSCIIASAELHLFLIAYSMLLNCFRSEFR